MTVPPAIGLSSCQCKEGYRAKDELHCEGSFHNFYMNVVVASKSCSAIALLILIWRYI